MTESANKGSAPGPGLRARKREATRSAITSAARRFTADHGLSGFTIEQLCEDVGISRRTFFNYFPSKEDAIVGHLLDEFPAEALAAFAAGGSTEAGAERGPHGLTTTLLRDLFALTVAMADQMDFTRENVRALIEVMKVEPQLMIKMMGSAEAREHEFADIIAQREGLDPDDPAALLVASLFGTLSRRASQRFFSEENTLRYPDILAGHLAQARQFFVFSALTFEGTR
ncbi:TetR family transcriptional regulator [Arthrobacter wenxiniae]|uniref:TetR/AcrR family transcriptional regulator n=1 Tax=Arthrobacter wenxiniae TaxID=2713570 RepID=A0A7Y7IFE3_9MICC|nr:TetR/AcrR family transcriptional regulator [Arthrobacter wenxiniae]